MYTFSTLWILATALALSSAEKCTSPQVQATSYTPSDAQVLTHIPYIAEFTLVCANGASQLNLFADINGAILPVLKSADGTKYQVGWTEELKVARTGDRTIRLYDDEGYNTVKRHLEKDESIALVKPLVQIVVNYPGAFTGPWAKSEHVAALTIFLLSYLAYGAKRGILA